MSDPAENFIQLQEGTLVIVYKFWAQLLHGKFSFQILYWVFSLGSSLSKHLCGDSHSKNLGQILRGQEKYAKGNKTKSDNLPKNIFLTF